MQNSENVVKAETPSQKAERLFALVAQYADVGVGQGEGNSKRSGIVEYARRAIDPMKQLRNQIRSLEEAGDKTKAKTLSEQLGEKCQNALERLIRINGMYEKTDKRLVAVRETLSHSKMKEERKNKVLSDFLQMQEAAIHHLIEEDDEEASAKLEKMLEKNIGLADEGSMEPRE